MLYASTTAIQALLAGSPATTQPTYSVFWVDTSANGLIFTPTEAHGSLNGTSAVAIVSDDNTVQRAVKTIAIYNADTAAVTLTIRHGTGQLILKVTLAVGDTLHYEDGRGWYVSDSSGQEKVAGSGGGNQSYRKNSTGSVLSRPRLNVIEGSGITLTMSDDSTDNEVDLTIASSVSSYTDEQAQDALASAFAAGTHTGITITYTDGSNKFDFVVTSGLSSIGAWEILANNTGSSAVPTGTSLAELQIITPTEGMYVLGWNDDSPEELCVFDASAIADMYGDVAGQYRTFSANFTEANFTAAATTETLDLGLTLPSGARVKHVDVKTTTAFSGGGSVAATIDIGTAGTPNLWISSYNAFAAVSDTNGSITTPSTFAAAVPGPSSTVVMKIKLSSNVNVSAFTAGALTVKVHYVD